MTWLAAVRVLTEQHQIIESGDAVAILGSGRGQMIDLRLLGVMALIALPASSSIAAQPAKGGAAAAAPQSSGTGQLNAQHSGIPGRAPEGSGASVTKAAGQSTEDTCSTVAVNYNTVDGIGAGTNLPASGVGGVNNSLFGFNAGNQITTGSYNDFSGALAGANTASGTDVNGNEICGGKNVFVGNSAGQLNTFGSNNIYIGFLAGSLGSGYDVSGNVAIGVQAGYQLTASCGAETCYGANNVYLGYQAGLNAVGIENTMIGFSAGSLTTTGSYDVFVGGHLTGDNNQTGDYDDLFGLQAGHLNTTGNANDFFGLSAGYSNVSGSYNDLYGFETGYSSTGSYSSAFGAQAGRNLTASYDAIFGAYAGFDDQGDVHGNGYNAAIGYGAAYDNHGGYEGVFVGYMAGYSNTSGDANVAVGWEAGYNSGSPLQTGYELTFLGAAASASADGFGDSTAVGSRAVISENNQVVLGDRNTSYVTTSGVVNSGTSSQPGGAMLVSKYVTSFQIKADTTGTMSATVKLTFPSAANGWACPTLRDISHTPNLVGHESETTASTVWYTFTATPTYSDTLVGGCTGSF